MNIVCATDDNFVQHCCIMLVSLLCNNKDVDIYVLTEGLRENNKKIIEEEVAAKGGKVNFCIVDNSVIESLPLSQTGGLNHISKATYYRLLLSDILPLEINKVIYLDCDIIVNDSLEELWNIDMTDKAIAASLQIGSGYNCERLGYPIKDGYFNAGVTLLNLTFFRANEITKELLEYAKTHHDQLQYNDQDVLNGVLHDRSIHILPQWNMTSACYDFRLRKRGDKRNGCVMQDYAEEKANIRLRKMNPNVVHYVSKPKPWDADCVHPLCHLYFDYAAKTINFNNTKVSQVMAHLHNLT